MTVWTNLENAVRSGLGAWTSGHIYPLFKDGDTWDDWDSRSRRYQQHELYYTNTQYSDLNALALMIKEGGRLYVNTRSIYNPVSRMVGLYADKIYPAMIDLDTLTTGAIPVVANDTIRNSLIQLFRWSNWNGEKQLYVRQGEKLGDAFIKVVDDLDSRRVVLEVLSAQKVRYLSKDRKNGNIKEIWIEYYVKKNDRPTLKDYNLYDGSRVKITEIITQDSFRIFENDKPVDSWDNPFGFVPVVHAKPSDEGFMYGASRWETSIPKIDEINSQAALLNDQVRKAIIPYIATIGGKLNTDDLNTSNKKMDELINIAVGLGGDVKMIAPQIDIASALKNIVSQLDELREDNPELFMYQLTDMSLPPSGVALRQFFDLGVNRITGAQGVYDDALIRACQMAMTVGGVNGYEGFPYDINSFDRGDLNFGIRPRDVIYDAVPETTTLNVLMASGAPRRAIWTRLHVSEDDQDKWETMLNDEQEAMINAQIDQYNRNTQEATGNPNGNVNSSAQSV